MRTHEKYGGLDLFRPIAALLVVAIHTSPLTSLNADADFFLTRVLARVAVPFFFMATGQFAVAGFLKSSGASSLFPRRYLAKLSALYLMSILLYLPIGIYAGHYENLTFGAALKMLFFDGTFYHLWYFPACLTGVLTVCLLHRFLKPPALLAAASALYLIGLLGDSYYGLAEKLPALKGLYDCIFLFSSHTRNGLFFAPLFLVLGMYVPRKPLPKLPAKPRRQLKKIYAGLCIFAALMTAEAFILRHFALQRHDSMYLMLPPVMILLYQALSSLSVRPRRQLRYAALWIYILHPAVIVLVRGAAKVLKLTPILVDNSLLHYLAVAALSIGGGICAALIQNRLRTAYKRSPKPRSGHRPSPTGRAWIELDRKALSHNVSLLRSMLPEGCRLMPAVKANAYGHGAVLMAGELNRLGVDAFCVACPAEGAALRRAKIRGEILILGRTAPEDLPLLARYHLTQTVLDHPYAEQLSQSGIRLHVHIGIDTGMHRFGIPWEDAGDILSVFRMKNLSVDGMLTHLAACDSSDDRCVAFTEAQIQAFNQTVRLLTEHGIACPRLHIHSSYGLINYPCRNMAYARPGILLYGVHSCPEYAASCRESFAPVLSLKARVASVRTLSPGDCAGYGPDFTAERPTRIAVLSIGYADGLPRLLSGGRGFVLIEGRRAPVIGRICMDLTLVDVSGCPSVKPGDIAVIIGSSAGREINAEEMADRCGTITNELLSRLGTRLERFFVETH